MRGLDADDDESDDVIASLWRLLEDRGDDVGNGDGDLESDDVIASLWRLLADRETMWATVTVI